MPILLTSFMRARPLRQTKVYSVARWQPDAETPYPELAMLAATDAQGRKLSLRSYRHPIAGYCAAYSEALAARWSAVSPWLRDLPVDEPIALACWCPYASHSRRQLDAHGTFFCHTVLIGELLRRCRPDVLVCLDEDRQQRAWQHVGTGWWGDSLEDCILMSFGGSMRVLLAAAMVDLDTPRFSRALDALRTKVAGKAEVVSARDVPWEQVRASEGNSWSRAYAWAARQYDAIVVLESEAGGLGAGTFDLAVRFKEMGKTVGVVRDGVVLPVVELVPSSLPRQERDWKRRYGVALVAGQTLQEESVVGEDNMDVWTEE